jgi:hypothetical protein
VLDEDKASIEAFMAMLGIRIKSSKYKPSRLLSYYKIHGMEQMRLHKNIEGKYWILHIKVFTP